MEAQTGRMENTPTLITHEIPRMDIDAALAVLNKICPESSRLKDYDPEGDSDTITVELPQDKLVTFMAQLTNERRLPQYRPR